MKIILLANWGLGLEILKCLHSLPNIEIIKVITQYDRNSDDPWHNVVYNFAQNNNCIVHNQKDRSFKAIRGDIDNLGIDLLITHSYMRILPSSVFSAPKKGTMNIHPSLLPQYRGPSPTYWILKNNEKMTGITCHYIDEGIDTGDIICQLEVPVEYNDTISTVIEKQKKCVNQLLTRALQRVADPTFKATQQQSNLASYAPKPNIIKEPKSEKV